MGEIIEGDYSKEIILKNKKLIFSDKLISFLNSEKLKHTNILDELDLDDLIEQFLSKDIYYYVEFDNKLHKENRNYEVLFNKALHIEILLKKIISIKLGCNINAFNKTSFSDLIDAVFSLDLIYEDTYENLHKYRLFRNNYAHKFLYNLGIEMKDYAIQIGSATVCIEELSEILNKLKNVI